MTALCLTNACEGSGAPTSGWDAGDGVVEPDGSRADGEPPEAAPDGGRGTRDSLRTLGCETAPRGHSLVAPALLRSYPADGGTFLRTTDLTLVNAGNVPSCARVLIFGDPDAPIALDVAIAPYEEWRSADDPRYGALPHTEGSQTLGWGRVESTSPLIGTASTRFDPGPGIPGDALLRLAQTPLSSAESLAGTDLVGTSYNQRGSTPRGQNFSWLGVVNPNDVDVTATVTIRDLDGNPRTTTVVVPRNGRIGTKNDTTFGQWWQWDAASGTPRNGWVEITAPMPLFASTTNTVEMDGVVLAYDQQSLVPRQRLTNEQASQAWTHMRPAAAGLFQDAIIKLVNADAAEHTVAIEILDRAGDSRSVNVTIAGHGVWNSSRDARFSACPSSPAPGQVCVEPVDAYSAATRATSFVRLGWIRFHAPAGAAIAGATRIAFRNADRSVVMMRNENLLEVPSPGEDQRRALVAPAFFHRFADGTRSGERWSSTFRVFNPDTTAVNVRVELRVGHPSATGRERDGIISSFEREVPAGGYYGLWGDEQLNWMTATEPDLDAPDDATRHQTRGFVRVTYRSRQPLIGHNRINLVRDGDGAFSAFEDLPLLPAPVSGATGPNMVVVMTDDLDRPTFDAMISAGLLPNIAGLRRDGVTFDNAFVTYSLCCPSRATFLTGQYAHNSGVLHNLSVGHGGHDYVRLIESSCLPVWLADHGYRTAWLGKYVNGYASASFTAGGSAPDLSRYAPPGWHRFSYTSSNAGRYDQLRDAINAFVDTDDERPDFLVVATNAPHIDTTDSSRFWTELDTYTEQSWLRARRDYNGGACGPDCDESADYGAVRGAGIVAALTDHPAFDEEDLADKPTWLRSGGYLPLDINPAGPLHLEGRPRLTTTGCDACPTEAALQGEDGDSAVSAACMAQCTYRGFERQLLDRAVSLLNVDRLVGQLRASYPADTVFVFTSDNGYTVGRHRLKEKRSPYEESIRVPLIIAAPGGARGASASLPVVNVDMAATLLEYAGATPDAAVDQRFERRIDGRSLVPLIEAPTGAHAWRQRFLIYNHFAHLDSTWNGWQRTRVFELPSLSGVREHVPGVRDDVYLEWYAPLYSDPLGDADRPPSDREYYDLVGDPNQLDNASADPVNAGRIGEMQEAMRGLRACRGAECRRAEE